MSEVDFWGRFRDQALDHCDQAMVLDEARQGNTNNKVVFTGLHNKMVIPELRLDPFGIVCSRVHHDHHHIVLEIHSDVFFRRLILFDY